MGTTICGRCKAWINDREWRCRSCGKLLPGLFGQRRGLDVVFARDRSQTRRLIYVLVACYLIELFVSQFTRAPGHDARFDINPTEIGLVRCGMLTPWRHYVPGFTAHDQPWRIVTAMLLHGGVFHILMNGLSLLSLGGVVEMLFGPASFWIVFVLTGLAGNGAVLAFSQSPVIGASGGIFGLFGAVLGWSVRRGGTVGLELRRRLMGALALNIAISFLPQISKEAHFGGFAAGFALTWLLRIDHQRSGREPDGVRFGAVACMGLLAVASLFAVAAAIRWPAA